MAAQVQLAPRLRPRQYAARLTAPGAFEEALAAARDAMLEVHADGEELEGEEEGAAARLVGHAKTLSVLVPVLVHWAATHQEPACRLTAMRLMCEAVALKRQVLASPRLSALLAIARDQFGVVAL